MISRRTVLIGLAGFVVGGAVATGTGLGYYYSRRNHRRGAGGVPQQRARAAEDGWLMTPEDRAAIAEGDAMTDSDVLEILDNTDIPGSGDYSAERVSRLGECIEACEADAQCAAFTFARSTHPQANKRQMCWLKTDMPQRLVTDTTFYVSGQRPGG